MSKKKSSRKYDETLVYPKTDNQDRYIRAIIENTITFCSGPAGSGKSYITAGIACQHLKERKIDRILITRPLVTVGKGVGFLPGELQEKISPFNSVMEEHLKCFLGMEDYMDCRKRGYIEIEPLEMMRGSTFKNTYMILDEAQNFTFNQIKMFLTRIGEGSKVIINGDIEQTDLSNHKGQVSGLKKCMDRLRSVKDVAICKLKTQDIQRHSIIAPVLTALGDE